MNRIFIDMDGVLADFDKLKRTLGMTGDELKRHADAFDLMEPVSGALEAVNSLTGMGYECWIATKPPTGIPHAYADKAKWILRHLPDLKRRIIMTHNKGLLGDEGDFLIDDRPHKASCEQFEGTLIVFDQRGWPAVLDFFRALGKTYIHIGSGGRDPNERRYTKRDVEMFTAIALALREAKTT